eukprot:g26406.t1
MGYGRWRGDTGPAAVPLPWNEGSGGNKAELAELSADASPLELGDWLAVCGPVLRDISAVSGRWWHLTLTEAQCYYDRWKTASPLERVQITPRLPDELMDVRCHRTEQRGVNLLLKAIPVDQQQSLITDRELTSTALLYRLLVRFQPGGAGEKAILLAKLTALDKANGISEWAAALRSWRRHFSRAREIGAILPDGTLLLKALEPAVIHISSLDAQAAFRLAQSRLQLGVDRQPHHDGVWRLSQCVLAEVETLALMSSTPTPPTTNIKANLASYVAEEMERVDVSNPEQGCYMEVLTQAIMQKVEVEELLLQNDHDQEEAKCQELEEEFLVTKTISSKEVWEDFENWVPSITAEYNQLVKTKEAVEQITKQSLRERAEAQGKVIEILPAKMVYTRKAGGGTRRARAVCCGNYSDSRFSGDCYAGGADGCQVRALVRTAAIKGWTIAATDIRVAFLNAPRRDDGKLVAMEIPSVYKRLGLAKDGEVWLVRLAMYGLTTSPRDWSQYRDRTLPAVSWVRVREENNQPKRVRGRLVKTDDENLWRLEEADVESGKVHWTGLMSVYVDDILISGEEATVSAALTSLQATWTTSSIEWASSTSAVHYCGFEITAADEGDGFHLSQRKYEQEILARWNVTESTTFPNFKVSEADMEAQDYVHKNQIREAQALAGSLLWLSTRSRPDLAYGVAALSRLVTRNPARSIEIGYSLLAYVKGTPGELHYPRWIKEKWGSRGQLKVQRHNMLLEVFADIAYGAGSNHRSVQGLVICLGGAPIAWQSATQPFASVGLYERGYILANVGEIDGLQGLVQPTCKTLKELADQTEVGKGRELFTKVWALREKSRVDAQNFLERLAPLLPRKDCDFTW